MISEIISFLGTHISLDGLPKKIGFKEEFSTVEQIFVHFNRGQLGLSGIMLSTGGQRININLRNI